MEFILTLVCLIGIAIGLLVIIPTLNRVGILEEVAADLDRDLKEVEILLAEAGLNNRLKGADDVWPS